MEVQIHSVDELKKNSSGKRSFVAGRMFIDPVQVEGGATRLKLTVSDSETVGGDDSFLKPARMIIERRADVVVDAGEIQRILEIALSEGALNLDDQLALRVIEHLAKCISLRLSINAKRP